MTKQETKWRKACELLADATEARLDAARERSACIQALTVAEKACREAVESERVAQRDLGIATEELVESRS
jgi:hypothetical protein